MPQAPLNLEPELVMKIVHLATHAQCIGNGTVNAMVDLACMQARAGHDVAVASSGGAFEPLLRRHGVTHSLLQQSRQPWRVPAMIAGFGRLIERFNPDIVHAHMMTGALISRFGSMRRHFALVTTVHHDIQKSASLMRFGDRVIVVSHAVGDAMLERGVMADTLSVVTSGTMGSPRFGRQMPRPLHLQHPNVVCVSAMFERNGIADLLHAFAHVRQTQDAQLYLVGDGPDRGLMEGLAEQLGIANYVQFTGFVADPRAYLAEADVFVFAAHQAPGPLVISEAREAGCAIVATKVGGVPEMLENGTAAVLVAPQEPMQLAAKVGWLLMDSPVRAQYAARAKRDLERFSVQRVCAEHLAVYEQAISQRAERQAQPSTRRAPVA
ncbi:glycosyltransferase involved in cell wall biosynthesis [Caballeronia udeis]|uniref:Glycosyltransferase involved in cell wall biosynthesis n=2 Tax=Caballeronia udeis TaxID=1232866 RepID=A0ABW8MDH9_9BURK